MTTDILNISEEQLVDYSKAHNEPSWMTELRKSFEINRNFRNAKT